jgi:hypothetical protein
MFTDFRDFTATVLRSKSFPLKGFLKASQSALIQRFQKTAVNSIKNPYKNMSTSAASRNPFIWLLDAFGNPFLTLLGPLVNQQNEEEYP